VNLQASAAVTDQVRAFMSLTTKLGRLFTALYEGTTDAITVEFRGRIAEEDTSALNLAALTGLLADVVDEPVTYVNAPLTAQDRGLKLVTMTSPAARDYVSLVRLTAEGEQAVAGTLTGPTNTERLVELWGFGIDMVPSDHMVFLRYVDRPGIIGKIGTILGDADVNVATMQVGRHAAGGDALIAMATDSAVPPAVAHQIAEEIGASHVRAVSLA
jgi:D-3-phosphoglycerate dehydrogenase